MISILTGFVSELRQVGIPVSMVEAIDAATAIEHIPLADRQALRHGLAACLVVDILTTFVFHLERVGCYLCDSTTCFKATQFR